MTLGEKIKFHRKRCGLTMKKLGELCGFHNRGDVRIAQYENGSRNPKYETLERIADVLGVSVDELSCGDCKRCPYREGTKGRKVIIHLEDDPGYETEVRDYRRSDEDGFLYDNLD